MATAGARSNSPWEGHDWFAIVDASLFLLALTEPRLYEPADMSRPRRLSISALIVNFSRVSRPRGLNDSCFGAVW
jgi:hypothetical protein